MRKILFCTLTGLVMLCSTPPNTNPTEPRHTLQGIWIGDTSSDRSSVLVVYRLGSTQFSFSWYTITARNLMLSGDRYVVVLRKGMITTNDRLAYFLQKEFKSSFRTLDRKAKQIENETIDRRLVEDSELFVLSMTEDGLSLKGSEDFRRLTPLATPIDMGLIIDIVDGSPLALSSSSSFGIIGQKYDLVRSLERVGEVSIQSTEGEFSFLKAESGSIGDVVLPKNWQSYKEPKQMSKEEILKKLKRGEKVPEADLIRALGNDG